MDFKKGLIFLLILVFLTIGCVSASDVDNNTDLRDAVGYNSNLDSSMLSDSPLGSSNITVKVNYEYSDDNGKINPTININNGKVISNEYDGSTKNYKVKINYTNILNKFNLSISAPGYLTQYKLVDITGINDSPIVFNLIASDSYKLGRDVTAKADKLLDFKTADKVLAITTAGVPKLNGKTSEGAIDGILNYATGYISYGRGNLLMLRQTAVDPIDFCFVIKKGNALKAAIFLNGNKKEAYFGTISEFMSHSQWNTLCRAIGSENAFSFASLANGWVDGVTYDVLQEAAFHGHICEGTLGGYTITKALLQYYPPVQETASANQSPGDITSYKILGIPGDSSNDAVIFFLDATAGKGAYFGFNTTSTGATSNMLGFIRWNGQEKEGTIIVMEYDSKKNKKSFEKETGITVKGSLEELKYNSWWINKIYKNPASLVNILIEKDKLTEEQYYYLIGSPNNVTSKNGTVIKACNTHGLDYNYIKNLDLPTAKRENKINEKGNLTYNDFKEIGKIVAKKAKSIFENELGVKIYKDMPNLMVLTSAGYVMLNEQSTEACWDGLFEVLGSRLSRLTLLPDHKAIWTPLWFNFALKQDDGSLMSIYIRYNPNGTFFVGEFNGSHTYNINISTLNNSALSNGISSSAYPDKNYFSIQSISNAWYGEPAFDQIMSFLYHNHACPGVQPGFFITEYIQSNFPLNENQSYVYIANEVYCKDDSLEYILDISPGLGNYLVQKLTSDEYKGKEGLDEEGILIIWDSSKKIGQAVTINFKWPTLDLSSYSTSEAKRAAQIQAFIDLYKKNENPHIKEKQLVSHSDNRWITEEQFNRMKSGGNGSSLKYLRELPELSKEDLLKQIADKNKKPSNNKNDEIKGDNSALGNNTKRNHGNHLSNRTNSRHYSNNHQSRENVGELYSIAPSTFSDPVDDGDTKNDGDKKAYEVSKDISSDENSLNPLFAIIVVLIIVGACVGFVIARGRKNNEG